MSRSSNAPQGGPEGGLRASYRAVFRRDVFSLLFEGYERARRTGSLAGDDEPVVTSRIVDGVEDFLRMADARYDRYHVTPERPVRSAIRFGKERRKIDIRIDCSYGRRVSFSIEAKRLRDPANCPRDYVGPDGLELFVEGEYGSGDPEGGMVGYVQSENTRDWYPRVAERIRVDARSRLKVLEEMQDTTEHPELLVGRSRHARSEGTLDVYHVFLDCCDGDDEAA